MEKGTDYRITKLEKSPLQRFKNQNLLTKRFGKPGTLVYKAITGKRTSSAIFGDLELEQELFDEILAYMEEAGMVQLEMIGPTPRAKPKEASKDVSIEPEDHEFEAPKEPKEEMVKEEIVPEEEPKKKPARSFEFEKEITSIEPAEEIAEKEEPPPEKPVRKIKELEEEPAEEPEENSVKQEEPEFELPSDEIVPIEEKPEKEPEDEKEEPAFEEPVRKRKEPSEELAEEAPSEEKPEEETEEQEEAAESEEIQIEEEHISPVSEQEDEEEGLSPVEKIIKEKYGDVGIKVYTLIDGQRTAEEIMKQTGLSESKLVEILDFMDDEGIIKLEYPGEKKKSAPVEQKPSPQEKEGFNLMLEESGEAPDKLKDKNPIEVPVRAPLNMVETLYTKSKILLKFGDKGGRVFESINGKTDVLELALKNQVPIYEIESMINFLLEQKAILLKPLQRAEIRKKYGDEGYSVYKVYGKEGVMLYELVDKDMRIKEMAKYLYADVPANKDKLSEMFLFIHQILKIDLPVDKDLLRREFESA